MGRKKKVIVPEPNPKSPQEIEREKNLNKWEKIMTRAFNSNTDIDSDYMYEKIKEKFDTDQEVKNIITDLYIKLRNSEYFSAKQKYTLKKFNLQEDIYREENKLILENERKEVDKAYTEAIQKLEANHMVGFEQVSILRNKIIEEVQRKYSISEENMKELVERFNMNDVDDENISQRRSEDQLKALKKIIDSDKKLFNYTEVDKKTFFNAKTSIKKYEKDLEMKAMQNEIVIESEIPKNISSITKSNENYNFDGEFDEIRDANEEAISIFKEDKDVNKLKLSDFISFKDENPQKIIEEIKSKAPEEYLQRKTEREYKREYKSEILNDFDFKLKKYGKLSNFDMHILLYVFHTITNELIAAKNSRKEYTGDLDPTEVSKFLKQFKETTLKYGY